MYQSEIRVNQFLILIKFLIDKKITNLEHQIEVDKDKHKINIKQN